MLRSLIAVALFNAALAGKLSDCAGNADGYCYGYLSNGDWCWLTFDGKQEYALEGYKGYSCKSYNGYEDHDYCENAKSSTKKEAEHSSDAHTMSDGGAAAEEVTGAPSAAGGSSDSGGCKTSWSCPSSWTTGGQAPHDAPDAKAFIAVNNVYRCMHDVQAVQWDADVYASAKKWADYTGKSMSHSHGDWCPSSDGENLAGTFAYSEHRGVDATHAWYSEIAETDYCGFQKSCYQSFSAGHFTAMIWSTINRIAYADPTDELAVGRYRGCDGNPPNFNGEYASKVPAPVKNYATCRSEVLGCSAFKGLSADDLEGCGTGAACCKGSAHGGWYMTYKEQCAAKYHNIVSQAARLYDLPEVLQPLASNPWPLAVAGSACALLLAFAVQRAWRKHRAPQFGTAAYADEGFIEVENAGPEDGLE